MITAEIHARSLVKFYCQYADRHINLKFMRRVIEIIGYDVIWRYKGSKVDIDDKMC